jgi:FAD/FMN-containing dehydrogenase
MALSLDEAAIQQFKASVRGQLLRAEDEGYDAARRVWNGMIDRRPALILRCTGVADVLAAVTFAREHALPVAIRGGGHNVAGNAVCDGGMVLDLSPMKGMRIDPTTRRGWAQAGLTWGEFDRETQAFGLATTGGLISTTGIAGLTLGGGIGWLMRKYGLTCDNLLSVDIVTADGEFRRASADEHADLFWGLRGGGGNFGVVTTFEYQLHPVGPMVLGGLVLYPVAQAKELLHFYRDYTASAPDELTTVAVFLTAPPAPFVPEHFQGKGAIGIAACYAGPIEEGERVVQPLRQFGPPVVDLLGPLPYTALQSMLDATAPPGLQNYWKSEYLSELSDGAIDVLVSYGNAIPSPLSHVDIHQMGGAVSRVAQSETAFGHRAAPFLVNIISTWTDAAENERNIRWTRELWGALQPFSAGGTYVNFMSGDEGTERVKAAYDPAIYERLVALKTTYDPTNLFRFNQNIPPRQ